MANQQLSPEEQLKLVRIYQKNPVLFIEQFLGHDLWSMQKEILMALTVPNARVAVKSAHSIGKCVKDLTNILMYNGDIVQAKDLVGKTFTLPTLNTQGEVVPAFARAEWNAIEPVYKLTTEMGKHITTNAQHPVWAGKGVFKGGVKCKITSMGWIPLAQLNNEYLIAVPEILPIFGNKSMDEDKIKLLAYLIGGGAISSRSTIMFSQSKNKQLTEFLEEINKLDCEVRTKKDRPFDYNVRGRIKGKNAVLDLIRHEKLNGKTSVTKFIPKSIFMLPKEQLAIFLSRLYSTDGWAYGKKDGAKEIGYCSISRQLAESVQELLLRFGIHSSLVYKKIKGYNAEYCSVVNIHKGADILTFCEEIGIYGKEEAIENVRQLSLISESKNTNRTWYWRNSPPGTRWEKIKSVEYMGIEPTVAIEVPSYHTFCTPTMWSHNTQIAADSLIWHTATGGITVDTAPTFKQVKLLWNYVHDAASKHKEYFAGGQLNQQEWRISPTIYAVGISTNEGVSFQGFHAGNTLGNNSLLIIMDEAPGIRPDIFEAIQGIAAGGDVRILMLGNPTIASGPFYDAFTRERKSWKTFSISAFDTPNFAQFKTVEELVAVAEMNPDLLQNPPRPYLVTPAWVYDRFNAWTPESSVWQTRVLGEFATQSEEALISLAWIDRAQHDRDKKVSKAEEWAAGIDVAAGGESETVLTVRHGGRIEAIIPWVKEDPRGEVVAELKFWQARAKKDNKVLKVYIDAIGNGHYFVKHMEDEGFHVVPINVGAGVSGGDEEKSRFLNLKAQQYWNLRDIFMAGDIYNLTDDIAQGQLASIKYFTTANGKVQIESKETAAKRGVPSPDRAESIMLAFTNMLSAPTTKFGFHPLLIQGSASSGWNNPIGNHEKVVVGSSKKDKKLISSKLGW